MCMSKPKTPKAVAPAAAPPPPETVAERLVTEEDETGLRGKKKSARNALRIDLAPKTKGGGAGLNIPQ